MFKLITIAILLSAALVAGSNHTFSQKGAAVQPVCHEVDQARREMVDLRRAIVPARATGEPRPAPGEPGTPTGAGLAAREERLIGFGGRSRF